MLVYRKMKYPHFMTSRENDPMPSATEEKTEIGRGTYGVVELVTKGGKRWGEKKGICKNTADPLIEADFLKLFADGVMEGDPLSDPPTLPNAAYSGVYLQPIYEWDEEEEEPQEHTRSPPCWVCPLVCARSGRQL